MNHLFQFLLAVTFTGVFSGNIIASETVPTLSSSHYLSVFLFCLIILLVFILRRLSKKHQSLKLQTNQELNTTQQAAMIGSWDWNIKDKTIHFSETALNILGLDKNKPQLSDAEFYSLIYKADRQKHLDALKLSFKTGQSFKVELRCDLRRPSKRWLDSRGEIFFDENKQPYRMIGMHQDITQAVIQRQLQLAMKTILQNIIEHEKLEEILSKICCAVNEIEPSIQCVIYLSSENKDKLELHHCSSIPSELKHILNSITVKDESSELMQTLSQEDILFIEELNKLPTWQSANQVLNSLDISAYYGQPLFCNRQTTQGAICHYLQDKNIDSVVIHQIIDTASQVAAVAIDGQIQSDVRHKIQQQLYHSQKMDSIGHLTGGIAHDFNNILGSIVGYNSLARKIALKHEDEKLINFLSEVSIAAERARELISQMMIFSRSEPSKNISIDSRPVIKEVLQLVKSMIPSSITINYNFTKQLNNIKINPIALHQVVMNLLINAKDAIEDNVGTIDINIHQAYFKNNECISCHQTFAGDFICLEVTDTGHGIGSELLERIFDPFFTTKEIGRGSGMGLSVVHGILHEINGHIKVLTEISKGTSIKLYFPAVTEDEGDEDNDIFITESTSSIGNGEHIMVVDDDIPLSLLYEEILQSYGYEVSRFDNSQLALEAFSKTPSDYKLVVTDQTMPFLTGDEMSKQMLAIRPELPIIICTGFSEILNEQSAKEIGIKALLKKPVDMYELLDLINEKIQSL